MLLLARPPRRTTTNKHLSAWKRTHDVLWSTFKRIKKIKQCRKWCGTYLYELDMRQHVGCKPTRKHHWHDRVFNTLANVQVFPLPPSKPMPASCFDFCPRTSQSQSQSTSNGRCPTKSLSWEESKKSCCTKTNNLSFVESIGCNFLEAEPLSFPVFDTHQHLQGVNM